MTEGVVLAEGVEVDVSGTDGVTGDVASSTLPPEVPLVGIKLVVDATKRSAELLAVKLANGADSERSWASAFSP